MTDDNLEKGEALRRMLKVRPGSDDILANRESGQLEFKKTFDLGSGPAYARSLAAFANNEGGFLVFGVQPSPHKIIGVHRERFDAVDPVRLTDILNSYFSPEIEWEMGCIDVAGKTLGFIYVYQALEKPIIATKSSGQEIRESAVYYRYRGKSTSIRYPELRRIVDERLDRERRAWVQHLERISRSGPTKIGIIDTIEGKVFGAGAPFLIDERLLRQLKFIRKGSFRETGGAPTLRLIGDLKSMEGVTVERTVQTGIHYDDLVTAFLAERRLSEEDAKSYLIESAHQSTQYSPVFYFLSLAKISPDEAVSLIEQETGAPKSTKAALKRRLTGSFKCKPMGVISKEAEIPVFARPEDLLSAVERQKMAYHRRSLIYHALKDCPDFVRSVALELPPARLFEALSHLTRQEIVKSKALILGCLLDIFNQKFQSLEGSAKTSFRKAVACAEEQLFPVESFPPRENSR